MTIGIDISQIVYSGSGVARFTEGLVQSIIDYDTNNTWIFYFSSLRRKIPKNIQKEILKKGYTIVNLPIPPRLLSLISNDFHAISGTLTPFIPGIRTLDWFITSDWTEPKLPVKKATIVHDLVFKRYPDTLPRLIRETQEKRIKHVVRESEIIFTDSRSTADDLASFYDVDTEKLKINYPGVSFLSITQKNNSQLPVNSPFILTVGKQEPRKNIDRLIEAYLNFKQITGSELPLLIVGPEGWGIKDKQTDKDIHFLGYVSDTILKTLYQNALFFIYPSLYEGFGYPIIEAMLSGCPVATSKTSSMAEIAGSAALLFHPEDTDAITDVLHKLTRNELLRKELKEKGLNRSKYFTWKSYYNTLITTLSENNSLTYGHRN